MQKISVIESWQEGWKVFKNNWLIVIYATLIPAIVSMILEAIQKQVKEGMQIGVILVLLGLLYFVGRFLLSMLMNLGVLKIQLDVTKGLKPGYKTLFSGQGIYWKFIGATVLYSLVVLGGLILLIIPGIYLAIRYLFVPYLIVDKNLTIGEAFAKSTEMTKGKKWSILGFLILTVIFSLLGLIVLVVGVFVTSAIGYLAIVNLYRKLSGDGDNTVVVDVNTASNIAPVEPVNITETVNEVVNEEPVQNDVVSTVENPNQN